MPLPDLSKVEGPALMFCSFMLLFLSPSLMFDFLAAIWCYLPVLENHLDPFLQCTAFFQIESPLVKAPFGTQTVLQQANSLPSRLNSACHVVSYITPLNNACIKYYHARTGPWQTSLSTCLHFDSVSGNYPEYAFLTGYLARQYHFSLNHLSQFGQSPLWETLKKSLVFDIYCLLSAHKISYTGLKPS